MKLLDGKNYFSNIGLLVPEILLPEDSTDLTKWACIACDQYTSSPEYWQEYYAGIGDAPSAGNLVLPEICLNRNISLRGEKPDMTLSERIDRINGNMIDYVEKGILSKKFTGLVYVERTLPDGKVRKGFIAALDLEKYEFAAGAKSLITPTEETVKERIPPRLTIRADAPLELPHSLALVDDLSNGVFTFFESRKNVSEKLYDFDLPGGAGHITAYGITDFNTVASVAAMLHDLKKEESLYFIGDGNHSFAAAKTHWEALKKKGAPMDHPARFILTEIESLHDPAIVLEPIHRVVFDCDIDTFKGLLGQYFSEAYAYWREFDRTLTAEEIDSLLSENNYTLEYNIIIIVSGNRALTLNIDNFKYPFAVSAMTDFLDFMLPDAKVDYVHGTDDALRLTEGGFATAICLPKPSKREIFTIASSGKILPRKTFSMGEAETKRFYIEARKIR